MDYTPFQKRAIQDGQTAILIELANHSITWEMFEAEEAQMLLASGPVPPGSSISMSFLPLNSNNTKPQVPDLKKNP